MITVNRLMPVKSQSKILTFITHKLEPIVSIQKSLESETLNEGDVASPKA